MALLANARKHLSVLVGQFFVAVECRSKQIFEFRDAREHLAADDADELRISACFVGLQDSRPEAVLAVKDAGGRLHGMPS